MAEVYRSTNELVAHERGVVSTVHGKGDKIAVTADALLAPHHLTKRIFPMEPRGETHIDIDYDDTDAVVSLVGDNALALEFGHENELTHTYTPGLYILTTAADVLKSGWG